MRVLNLTVPISPLTAVIGADDRAIETQQKCRAWCMEWLPAIRAKLGLTQNYVADRIRVHRHTYRAVELGECVPSAETARRIFNWLDDLSGE